MQVRVLRPVSRMSVLARLHRQGVKEPGDGRSLAAPRQKMRRIGPEGKELLARVAKECGATFEHVRRVALGDIRSDRISDAISKEFETLRQAGVSGDALVKKAKT